MKQMMRGDRECDQRVHSDQNQKYPITNCSPMWNKSKHRKGVTERLVHHVPEVENLLRAGEKQDSLG